MTARIRAFSASCAPPACADFYAQWLSTLATAQTATMVRHVLPTPLGTGLDAVCETPEASHEPASAAQDQGTVVWLRKAGPHNPAWRYALLGAVARWLGLDVMRPVPNLGGPKSIATEAQRLRALTAAGVRVPALLAQQDDALLLGNLGTHTLLYAIDRDAERGDITHWLHGLHAIADVHQRGTYLSQAFARNMTVDSLGRIGFIDFEDDPAIVLPLSHCQARDWLCYLHSTLLPLRTHGLLPRAQASGREFFTMRDISTQRLLRDTVRPIFWMRHLHHPRWGRDTLRLSALAQWMYGVCKTGNPAP